MKKAVLVGATLLLVLVSVLVSAGCVVNFEPTGPDQHETQSVELDKSELVRVEIKLGAGELQVDGGAQKLMEGDFNYNIARSKPFVKYTSSGFRGTLNIEQPSTTHGGSHKWKLRLNDKVPMDISAKLGAGEARMNLGDLDLRSVQVDMGVGDVRLDLRGKPTRDYSVEINGGVGHATVYLPPEVGIVAKASGGIGDISVRGLDKRNGEWINPKHEQAPVTIHVEVHGGVGQINLIAE